MLKRISGNEIRVGMFVEAVEGEWLNAAFGRRFIIEDDADAQSLRRSNLSGVFINTALGVDITPSVPSNLERIFPLKAKRYFRKNEMKLAAMTLIEATEILQDVVESKKNNVELKIQSLTPIVKQIAASIESNPSILISIARLKNKDDTSYIHSVAVSALMIRFSRYLKFKDDIVHLLGVGGLVNDIGKTKVPTQILTKPGAFAEDEMNLMQRHPTMGHELLSRQNSMPDLVLDICLHHHDRIDGSGYPFGLKGQQITFWARMAAICDVYDAVTSVRPYRAPWTAKEAATGCLNVTATSTENF